mmetsp:Transcript_18465/g.45765  ORF Transcript_18465/g.45765 Transcript_18465/m.45765 type:complete len:616 (-) Transcript_18465:73-1920(-)|eukprot:CAMPEP_0113620664 /NCGR_PEP_ID=MMETSP0017_2-20120614/10536_1 /TAXON_ID=2856 /ORGANISM="Cylindrotheca closterium" /LENGTH=615 /DNA_ID=CAMNT_0000530345 /DNA_START=72 /DNA_END=1919 /DNA_ORIENTATION=+ /assembly_acc=CAM_ASM_000147
MDILQPHGNLNSSSDHDPLFYTSDEFMVELLNTPVRGAAEALEKSLFQNTHKALDIIKAPPSPAETQEFKQKFIELQNKQKEKQNMTSARDQFKKTSSFSSKFSDGVVVKIKSPAKSKPGKVKADKTITFSPIFRKSPKPSTVSRRLRSRSWNSSPEPKKRTTTDVASIRSDEFPRTSTLAQCDSISVDTPASLPPQISLEEAKNWVSSSSEWSSDLDISQRSMPQPPLQRIMSSVSEDIGGGKDNDNDDIPPPPPPPPPLTMTSLSPYNNALNKRSVHRNSARARLEGAADDSMLTPPHSSNSRRAKRLSFQVKGSGSNIQAPPPKTSWLVGSATPSPHTPRSRKSSKSAKRRKSRVHANGFPIMPFFDNDEELDGSSRSPVSPRKPPLFRPLDKTLMRDYPSTTTATTFLTADTDSIDYSMSSSFPLTKETERIILKRLPNKRDIHIEKSDGEKLGMIDFSMVNQGKRVIKDACGRTCAVIFLNNDQLGGKALFKICGNKPATRRQRLSNETGYYTWAEVKNTGSFGGKFVMNRFSPETSSCSIEQHWTKPFGSIFSRGKSKGYVFFDPKKKECVKMVSLKQGKGVIVGPNRDLCLMLGYVACVDEMLEHRLR